MSNEKFTDPFAEIAFLEHPGNQEELVEIPPISFEPNYLARGMQAAERLPERSHEQQVENFKSDLMRLREQYQPFLDNHAPAAEFKRKVMEIERFQFRYHTAEDHDFTKVLQGSGSWEQVTVPDFRGPTHEEGKWTGYYRTEFQYEPIENGKRVFLVFKGVDYKASVYLNQKCIGTHEGFFAPFEFDVTDYVQEHNVLVVEVENDYPMMGVNGTRLDGDKMYAATGPGWDDPETGWHHCPPGAGIYNKVLMEERAPLFIHDVFIRPNIDNDSAEVWVDVMNTSDGLVEDFNIQIDIFPKNFAGEQLLHVMFPVSYAGPGLNYYRYRVDFPAYRLWEPETPYLYLTRVTLHNGETMADSRDRHFGMRKFHMDESAALKGTLHLNNRPIFLRGANEMGHLQQCVMRNQYSQLIDDILIAKIANLNFYRITQRPVQEEIYDYMDMLGMMHQCDLPTFGFMRRNQFNEGVRQAAEMERLIRSHPSSIMVSLINEPSRTEKRRKGHRHMHRNELEAFFVAARQAIYIENPDRVVKNCEGDYNPPTNEGLSDFHCYNMWYTNNTMTVGKMHKGYLPSIKPGWKTGCGEYGTEGLDHYDLMMKSYPKEWLPANPDEWWMPDGIIRAQTFHLHGDWFAEQNTIQEWIQESQKHQSLATKLMTDAWRRRADYIVSTAIHLLIDAWPSGWMKALVGADRVPKPAFFTYQACMKPTRIHLRSDRWKAYEGEMIDVEAWLLNDRPESYKNCRIIATLRDELQDYAHYETMAEVPGATSSYAGTIRFYVPSIKDRNMLYIDACLVDEHGHVIDNERFALEAFAKHHDQSPVATFYLGSEAGVLCSSLKLDSKPFVPGEWNDGPLIVSCPEQFAKYREVILDQVKSGASVMFIRNDSTEYAWELDEHVHIKTGRRKKVYVLAAKQADPRLAWMKADDLAYFYNLQTDRIEELSDMTLDGTPLDPILFTYDSSKSADGNKVKLPVVGTKRYGQGELAFIALPLSGRIGLNPTLDRFLLSMLS